MGVNNVLSALFYDTQHQIATRVREIIADIMFIKLDDVKLDYCLGDDLDVDDVDMASIIRRTERTFHLKLTTADSDGIVSVGCLVDSLTPLVERRAKVIDNILAIVAKKSGIKPQELTLRHCFDTKLTLTIDQLALIDNFTDTAQALNIDPPNFGAFTHTTNVSLELIVEAIMPYVNAIEQVITAVATELDVNPAEIDLNQCLFQDGRCNTDIIGNIIMVLEEEFEIDLENLLIKDKGKGDVVAVKDGTLTTQQIIDTILPLCQL